MDVSSGAAAVAAPRPSLRVIDAMALIVGTVVGAGIFRTPSLVAANVGSETAALYAWLAGGAVSLIGALCYAELTTTYPHAGGDYHYLTRAFGQRLAFLFAWARMSVIQTGSIALLAFVMGDYASQLVGLGPNSAAVYAVLAVVALTALNVIGVQQGKFAQNVLTAVEVGGLLLVVVAGLVVAPPTSAAHGPAPATSAFGLVMVFVLLTYGGWNEAAYISAEVHDPRRNMSRALVASILVITGLYLLVNWAYLRGLGLAGMAASSALAADLMSRWLGSGAARLVSLFIVVSAITSANAAIFTGARTTYALGRDFRPFRFLGRWHPGTGTPVNALVIQGLVACLLVGLGAMTRRGFETMVDYTAPVFWLFFLLTGLSLFVLRRKEPAVARPFLVPFYPVIPLLFCATCAYLLYASLRYTGVGALVGVGVLVVGGIVLALASRGGAGPTLETTRRNGELPPRNSIP
jgi:amino acid transporter